jgi:hypothetical protein
MINDRIVFGLDGFPAEGSRNPELLPCGATSHWDNTGWRCDECMAIWGSIGCSCSRDLERAKELPISQRNRTIK